MDEDNVYNRAHALLTDKELYARMSQAANPYGDGQASKRIAEAILHHFGRSGRPEPFRR
jgi:UDP-N-acetylglucosamine 2-epimerase (non-hydrolysing)